MYVSMVWFVNYYIVTNFFTPRIKKKIWFLISINLLVFLQILVQSHFELVSSVLALEASEPVSELGTQMAVEQITIISFQYSKRDECKSCIPFYVKTTANKFWKDAEKLLKSFWTSHFQMMNGPEALF